MATMTAAETLMHTLMLAAEEVAGSGDPDEVHSDEWLDSNSVFDLLSVRSDVLALRNAARAARKYWRVKG